MNPLDELSIFLIQWAKENDYSFFLPKDSNEDIATFYVDVPNKSIYINGHYLSDIMTKN